MLAFSLLLFFFLADSPLGSCFVSISNNFTTFSLSLNDPRTSFFEFSFEDSLDSFPVLAIHAAATNQYNESYPVAWALEEYKEPKKCFNLAKFHRISFLGIRKTTLKVFSSLSYLLESPKSQSPSQDSEASNGDNPLQREQRGIRFKLIERDSKGGAISSQLFTYSNLKNLPPAQFFFLRFPQSVQDGLYYYPLFNENHLERDLGLSSLSFEESKIPRTFMMSHPRSGTHMIRRTLEHIFDEFINNFLGEDYAQIKKSRKQQLESGELRGYSEFTRIMIEHSPANIIRMGLHVNKLVLVARNPIDAVDSNFHLENSRNSHLDKIKGEYWNSRRFQFSLNRNMPVTVFHEMLVDSPLPFYVVRYEDELERPFEVFCEVVSYIESVPCEFSWNQKVKEFLEKNGLVSFYKRTTLDTTKNQEEKKFKIIKKYPKEIVEVIYTIYLDYIKFCGYNEIYKGFVSENLFKETKGEENTQYLEKNRKSLEKSLNYELGHSMNFRRQLGRDEEVWIEKRKLKVLDLLPAKDMTLEHEEGHISSAESSQKEEMKIIPVPNYFEF